MPLTPPRHPQLRGWCGQGGSRACTYPIGLSVLEQLIKRDADVFGDLTKQDWGNVSTLMKRYRGAAAGGITKLFVRTALANFGETESEKYGYDFTGFEDRNIAHDSSYGDVLNSNKFGLQRRFAVFKQHCNNVVQVVIDLIQRFALGMSAGKTGNEPNEQASLRAPLNYCRIDFHGRLRNHMEKQIIVLRSAIGNQRCPASCWRRAARMVKIVARCCRLVHDN